MSVSGNQDDSFFNKTADAPIIPGDKNASLAEYNHSEPDDTTPPLSPIQGQDTTLPPPLPPSPLPPTRYKGKQTKQTQASDKSWADKLAAGVGMTNSGKLNLSQRQRLHSPNARCHKPTTMGRPIQHPNQQHHTPSLVQHQRLSEGGKRHEKCHTTRIHQKETTYTSWHSKK